MLKNISSHFIKLIFIYIDEKQKLKIVKCNKNLQKNIDINIINYKFFTGKYIIYQSKRIGKEYIGKDNILVYEGEYLNGERNGKGKEYYRNGKLKFEGEYLLGKEWIGSIFDGKGNIILNNNINGKGKEYAWYDILRFEGEYLNGKRQGKGKEYFDNGQLLFEGEYLNDLKWNGKGYDKSGNIIYELKGGKGLIKEYNYRDSLIFEGEYLNGKRNGKGKEDNGIGSFKFEGEYLNGEKNGKGKEYEWFNGILLFEGEYLNGKRNGKGKEYYWDGKLKFEGEYLYGYRLKGKYYLRD